METEGLNSRILLSKEENTKNNVRMRYQTATFIEQEPVQDRPRFHGVMQLNYTVLVCLFFLFLNSGPAYQSKHAFPSAQRQPEMFQEGT
jgi:hypothetical protein